MRPAYRSAWRGRGLKCCQHEGCPVQKPTATVVVGCFSGWRRAGFPHFFGRCGQEPAMIPGAGSKGRPHPWPGWRRRVVRRWPRPSRRCPWPRGTKNAGGDVSLVRGTGSSGSARPLGPGRARLASDRRGRASERRMRLRCRCADLCVPQQRRE